MKCDDCIKFQGCKHGRKGLAICNKYLGWRTDRPPEDGVYLCTVEADNVRIVDIKSYMSFCGWMTAHEVKAWQPLPEVFK